MYDHRTVRGCRICIGWADAVALSAIRRVSGNDDVEAGVDWRYREKEECFVA